MSVKIRLARVGRKKVPMYRVVVADERSPRDGRFIEILGQYQPLEDPSMVNFKEDRALEWLSKGAQPTETVEKLLKVTGIWEKHTATLAPKKVKNIRVSKSSAKKAPAKKAPAKASAKPVEKKASSKEVDPKAVETTESGE
ncbi:MAG: 30S ribosomal protein S16 [Acidimicrobiia bacterium]|nr:30S ribosomal protein S16 [Acidimicrobiia bacterium]